MRRRPFGLQRSSMACAGSSPPAPDGNDWLKSCGDQAVLYPLVLDAIAAVMSLM